jgi:hypothetical protein
MRRFVVVLLALLIGVTLRHPHGNDAAGSPGFTELCSA